MQREKRAAIPVLDLCDGLQLSCLFFEKICVAVVIFDRF